MIKHARVTVGTTATLLDTYQAFSPPALLILQNTGSVSVYLGDSTVSTTSYGYELKAGTEVKIDRFALSEQIYGVVSVGTNIVNTLMQGA